MRGTVAASGSVGDSAGRRRPIRLGLCRVVAAAVVLLAACGERPERPAVETGTVSPETADGAVAPGRTPPTTPAGAPNAGVLPPGVTEQVAQDGRAVYGGAGICYTCHGARGEGGPLGPALNDPEWIHLAEGSYDEILQIIRTGVQQPERYPSPMPPMGGAQLTDGQLRAVAAYVYLMSRGR